jgi:hypothetical protein
MGGPHVKNLKAEGISEVRLCSLALPEWSEKEKKGMQKKMETETKHSRE